MDENRQLRQTPKGNEETTIATERVDDTPSWMVLAILIIASESAMGCASQLQFFVVEKDECVSQASPTLSDKWARKGTGCWVSRGGPHRGQDKHLSQCKGILTFHPNGRKSLLAAIVGSAMVSSETALTLYTAQVC